MHQMVPTKYYSQGQEYAHFTSELLKAKDSLPITRAWEINSISQGSSCISYPPPDSEKPTTNPSGEGKTINAVTNEQLELQEPLLNYSANFRFKGKNHRATVPREPRIVDAPATQQPRCNSHNVKQLLEKPKPKTLTPPEINRMNRPNDQHGKDFK